MKRRPGSTALICAVLTVGITAGPATATPGSDQTASAQPVWAGCERFITDTYLPTAECTSVPVPIDAADPAGAQAQLAVIRIPATGRRIGALLMNPGGPGASAVDLVVNIADALSDSPITEHFDLVGFDPRGVGYSTPELRCRTDAEVDAWRREPMVDFSQAGVARGFDRAQRLLPAISVVSGIPNLVMAKATLVIVFAQDAACLQGGTLVLMNSLANSAVCARLRATAALRSLLRCRS